MQFWNKWLALTLVRSRPKLDEALLFTIGTFGTDVNGIGCVVELTWGTMALCKIEEHSLFCSVELSVQKLLILDSCLWPLMFMIWRVFHTCVTQRSYRGRSYTCTLWLVYLQLSLASLEMFDIILPRVLIPSCCHTIYHPLALQTSLIGSKFKSNVIESNISDIFAKIAISFYGISNIFY